MWTDQVSKIFCAKIANFQPLFTFNCSKHR